MKSIKNAIALTRASQLFRLRESEGLRFENRGQFPFRKLRLTAIKPFSINSTHQI